MSTTDKANCNSIEQAYARLLSLFLHGSSRQGRAVRLAFLLLFSILIIPHLNAQTSSMKLSWRYATGGAIRSRPVLGEDGTIYVLSEDRYLYAINPEGRREWRCRLGEKVSDCLGRSRDGTLYIGLQSGKLIAVNSAGNIIWKIGLDDVPAANPHVLNDGTVIVTGEGNAVYAVSHTGYIRWKRKIETEIIGPLSVKEADGGKEILFIPARNGNIYALSRFNELLWVESAPGIPAFITFKNETLYAATDNGFLCAYDAAGTLLWEKEVEEVIGSRTGAVQRRNPHEPIVAGKLILYPARGGDVLVFDTEGNHVETKKVQTGTDGAIRCTADDRGTLYCVTETTGISDTVFDSAAGPLFGEPVLSPNGRLYVGGGDWIVYAFETDAEIIEERAPEQRYRTATGEDMDDRYYSNMDYQFLKNLARSLDRNQKERFIREVTERAEDHALGKSEPYVIGLLTLLSGEGVLTPYLSEKQSTQRLPSLRIQALQLLGKIGSKSTASFLETLLRYEYDEHVVAEAVRAAAMLQVDPNGSLVESIRARIEKDSLITCTDRIAGAAIEAVNSIVRYRGSADAVSYKLLLRIVKSNYSREIREKALASLRALSR